MLPPQLGDDINQVKMEKDNAGLLTLVRSVSHLISGASLRKRFAFDTKSPERASLNIAPLGELLDLYHTRKATKRHDMIYALLGLVSGTPDSPGISIVPDYDAPWSQLFRQVISLCLPGSLSIITWSDENLAVVRGRGRVLGRVDNVKEVRTWGDTRYTIRWVSHHFGNFKYRGGWGTYYTIRGSAKHIFLGDIVCLLQGASRPSVIRVRETYAEIIALALPAWARGISDDDTRFNDPVDRALAAGDYPLQLELVWDWGVLPLGTERDFESMVRDGDSALREEWDNLIEKAARQWTKGVLISPMSAPANDPGFETIARKACYNALATLKTVAGMGYAGTN